MEDLAPPLKLLFHVKTGVYCGQSLNLCLQEYFGRNACEFSRQLVKWYHIRLTAPDKARELYLKVKSPYRRALIDLLESGLNGGSILEKLEILEKEIIQSCELEVEKHLQTLPIKTLLPLLVFQFPAYLILMLGPLFRSFLQELIW